MTEEIKEELPKTEKCECKGKCLKVFLLGILASFLGCLVALCIFSAAVRPKMPPRPMMYDPPQVQHFHQEKFRHGDFKGQKPKIDKGDFKKHMNEERPIKEQRPNFDED